jgi:hypothetical protein
MTDGLNQEAAGKFGGGFDKKDNQQRDGDYGPDIVNGGREELIEIDSAITNGDFEESQARVGSAGVKDTIKHGRDHQCDKAFGNGHEGEKKDPDKEAKTVRPNVAQQPLQLW